MKEKNDQCGNMEMHDNWFTDWKPLCITLFCNLFQYESMYKPYITLSCLCYKISAATKDSNIGPSVSLQQMNALIIFSRSGSGGWRRGWGFKEKYKKTHSFTSVMSFLAYQSWKL